MKTFKTHLNLLTACYALFATLVVMNTNFFRSAFRRQKGSLSFPWDKQKSPKENPSLEVNNWKVLTDAAWRIGSKGLESTFLKVICDY